jgi:hypothetical protein
MFRIPVNATAQQSVRVNWRKMQTSIVLEFSPARCSFQSRMKATGVGVVKGEKGCGTAYWT